MSTTESPTSCKSKLLHHGAAATSTCKVLTWLPLVDGHGDDSSAQQQQPQLVYASHAMINIAQTTTVTLDQGQVQEPIWNVTETLRTQHSYSTGPSEKAPTITALTHVQRMHSSISSGNGPALASGFSNGSLTVWNRTTTAASGVTFDEQVLVDAIRWKDSPQSSQQQQEAPRSITDLHGVVWKNNLVLLAACSSSGVTCYSYQCQESTETENTVAVHRRVVTHHTGSAVQWQALSESTLLLLIGTAAPRHNKIMIYSVVTNDATTTTNQPLFHFCGALTGHEDWVTCFAWQSLNNNNSSSHNYMLASGSQDFKIRLWKFSTTKTTTTANLNQDEDNASVDSGSIDDDDDDEVVNIDEEDFEENESRMEVLWQQTSPDNATIPMQTSVSFEALLLGHEGPVTAVHWYPNNNDNTDTKLKEEQSSSMILLSSSMDRSILLWSASDDDGIWAPISRVGSAGGILGGSIGSTLLGYVNFEILPQWLIGHAYGGALHVWHKKDTCLQHQNWMATPCVTGHFDGVVDLCWEATFGEYLLTVSLDQTCRLWAPVEKGAPEHDGDDTVAWVEVARPQVHGYNLSAVTSLSSPNHRHWIVSGADEKELRILDAPMTTVRMLKAIKPASEEKPEDKENADNNNMLDSTERVERAFIPSLGLSNKATAADGAEEDVEDNDDPDDNTPLQKKSSLPSERDLGALSLWLEKRKLFGHNTELYCVTSTLESQNGLATSSGDETILVASAAKARDVEDAAIRIWNPYNGACLQVLSGGHKATVATMSFSPDGGKYLASSGKDRRLCVWKRKASTNLESDNDTYSLAAAKDSAHKRIIWSVHFCPFEASVLASGSRDGNVKIWRLTNGDDENAVTMNQLFSFAPKTLNPAGKPDAVTALSFAPRPVAESGQDALLALGFECGLIELWSIPLSVEASSPETSPVLMHSLPSNLCHVATVTKLAWRPMSQKRDNKELTLASGSSDHGCRIFRVDLL